MNIKTLEIDILNFEKLTDSFPARAFDDSFTLTIQFKPFKKKGIAITSIGSLHCNKFSKLIGQIKEIIANDFNFERKIVIHFSDDCTNFDVSIVGIIASFKNCYPSINFEIKIPSDTYSWEIHSRFRDNLFLLRSSYFILTNQTLFSFQREDFLVSKYTEPNFLSKFVFLINETTFNDYFVSTNSSWDSNQLFKKLDKEDIVDSFTHLKGNLKFKGDSQGETNYNIVQELLKKYSNNLTWKCNNRLFFQEYLKMMSNFDLCDEIFKGFFDNDFGNIKFDTFTKRGFKELEMSRLKNNFREIVRELNEQPSFFVYIYCFLINRNIGSAIIKDEIQDGKIKKNKVAILLDRTLELLEFARNLFQGIREIARNIIDHTETKTGIVTGQVLSSNVLFDIKSEEEKSKSENDLQTYIDEINESKNESYSIKDDYFLDLTIFDEGLKGVISKTISNIKTLSTNDPDYPDLYATDIELLSKGEVIFSDFFDTEEIRLHHHAVKTASHWGLIIFANLIKKNKGLFYSSTKNCFDSTKYDTCVSYFKNRHSITSDSVFELGTYYNLVLPLDRNQGLSDEVKQKLRPKELNFSASNYYSLLKYEYIKDETLLKPDSEEVLMQISVERFMRLDHHIAYRDEILIANKVGDYIKVLRKKNKHFIPVIDFDNSSDMFDQSKLLRFLAKLQISYEVRDIIVTNVKSKNIQGLKVIINTNDESLNEFHFWNENHFILLFSYKMDDQNRRIYYTDILGGYTYSDLKKLRNKLSSTHQPLFSTAYKNLNESFSENTIRGIANSKLFKSTESGIVQNFELVLEYNFKTYFEISLENILNRSIGNENNLTIGYKIQDTHFRLGSKIHITEFIYAKQIFQSNFYSDRFAFLISKYVKDNFKIEAPITILGYGNYSQLLVNRTTEILKRIYNTENINNDIISDLEQTKVIKGVPIFRNVIVLVPINTTFSTAIKIENLAQEIAGANIKLNIISLNLILVSHENLDDPEYVSGLNDYLQTDEINPDLRKKYPYKLFNWKKIDTKKKIVLVKTNPPQAKETQQKYFITIASNWALPDECIKCFPSLRNDIEKLEIDYRLLENPLLETDKTSVTPDLLLDIPKSFRSGVKDFEAYSTNRRIWLNEEAHLSGHIEYGKSHFLNFIEPVNFFKKYLPEIEDWARICNKKLLDSDPDIFNKSILLISSSNNTNAYFIEFINRHVFKDAAIINHYEIEDDYVENFEKFFKNDIKQADYIFFVDDFILSGNTFHLINDFVRYCNNDLINKGETESKAIASCSGLFVLINKTDNYSQKDIITLLQKTTTETPLFFTFHQWKENLIKRENCPICKEKKKYELLADNSMLDTIKHFFLNKAKKLKVIKDSDVKKNNKPMWAKYNPLVLENCTLPWLDSAPGIGLDLWETFVNESFPEKNYLKMLVRHSINELLSDDSEILDFLNEPQNQTNQINIEIKKELLDLIIQKLIAKEPFCSWLSSYNEYTKLVFFSIFKEIVLKVFTQQPFLNIKPIRENVFTWILIELTENINEFKNSKGLSFKKFRYIKFLLRRVTILGSNFIIDSKTLNDFRVIYEKYPQEVKLRNERLREQKIRELNGYLKEYLSLFKKLEYELNECTTKVNSAELLLKATSINLTELFENEEYAKFKMQLETLKENKKSLENQYSLCEKKIEYVQQAKRNIFYKDISLKEFSYFYVSLIKELTVNNESKMLAVERNADIMINTVKANGEMDFYFLLRLIKFENIGIIKNGVSIILNDFVKNNPKIALENYCYRVREEIKLVLKEALAHYSLSTFIQFFAIVNVEEWINSEECNYIIHLIYLLESLRKENVEKEIIGLDSEDTDNISLEDKTQGLLRNLFRMICDPNFDNEKFANPSDYPYVDDKPSNGGFISLKYKGLGKSYVPPGNILITNTTHIQDRNQNVTDANKLGETEIDEYSLSYLMLNGFCGIQGIDDDDNSLNIIKKDYPLKPWTILELSYKNEEEKKYWMVNRGVIYPINKMCNTSNGIFYYQGNGLDIEYYFTEYSVIDQACKYIVLFRIAELAEVDNQILNDGKAVLTFYTSQKEIPIERLRLMLLVSPELSIFFKKHYEKDSLIALMEEKERIIESRRLKHGYTKFLGAFEAVANNSKLDPIYKREIIRLFKNQLETGPLLANKFDRIREKGISFIKNELNKSFIFKAFSEDELSDEIEKIVRIVYRNKIYDTSIEMDFDPDITITNWPISENFFFYHKILTLLITEVSVNAKKSQELLIDDTKWLRINIDYEENKLMLRFENNFKMVVTEGERTRLSKGNFKYSSSGLSLISKICEVFSQTKPIIQFNMKFSIFSIKIELNSL